MIITGRRREQGLKKSERKCSCGVHCGCYDFLLETKEVVDSLCCHYLAYHRKEITEEQLIKIFNDGEKPEKTPREQNNNANMNLKKKGKK